jgi:hypothetical protein
MSPPAEPALPPNRLLLLLCLLPCAGLSSCGGEESQTFDDARRSVRSWSMTLVMTAQAWNEGQVPALYVRQALDAGRESLGEHQKKLHKTSDPVRREQLRREISRLQGRMDEIARAVDRDDRSAAVTVIDEMRVDLNLTAPPPGSQGGEGS